jgi:ACR3 family arsenite efflux pump ArsB
VVGWLERRQVPLYVAAILAGVVLGLLAPAAGPGLGVAVGPVLGALLYVTFLQVPARELVRSLHAGRFLAAVLVADFVVAPLVVAAMTPLLPADVAVRTGVLLVLLAPCVDYVVVFTGLAGGSAGRLLAATPLLLLAQMALLPLLLGLLLGPAAAGAIEPGPFVEAFVGFILLPLALAWLTQAWAARHRSGEVVAGAAGAAMVPLMVATLLLVVASQVPGLGAAGAVLGAVPFYVVFLLVMVPLGALVARLLRLGTADARAVAFTGATRNSLVVLPLALALPAGPVVAATVVAQTLVEVVGMVVAVRAVPRVVALLLRGTPGRPAEHAPGGPTPG